MNRIQRAIHGDRIEKHHGDKRLFTSQKGFLLTKEDLLTIHSLGEFKRITPAEMLKEYEVYKLLSGLVDNITDEKFIEMLNLVEDERAYTQKSNEYLGRSLVVRDLVSQNQQEWTERLPLKTLTSRLSNQNEANLKEMLQLPNRALREAVESELIRRRKIDLERRNNTQVRSFTEAESITYDITPEARGLDKIGALKRNKRK